MHTVIISLPFGVRYSKQGKSGEGRQYAVCCHGLFMAAMWSLLGFALAFLLSRDQRNSLVVGLLVFSHWVLDFISPPMGMGQKAPPDLPLLLGGSPKVGLGLYNSVPAALATDLGIQNTEGSLRRVISSWKHIAETQSALVEKLDGKRAVTVHGPHIDLAFSIEERNFISSDGRLNMLDGEIYTAPVVDSVNGWMESSFPAIYKGVDIYQTYSFQRDGTVVPSETQKK